PTHTISSLHTPSRYLNNITHCSLSTLFPYTTLFRSPGNLLRPGQYGRVRTSTRTQEHALLIPQRAVTELQGAFQVAVVSGEDKIDRKSTRRTPVTVASRMPSSA